MAFRKLSETGSGVLALVQRDFAQIVFYRSKYIYQYKFGNVSSYEGGPYLFICALVMFLNRVFRQE